ncbi:hypothetical protein [Methylobacterium nigriterrae]|uniref:hypothetical protein n=1 Tax=Methylobacterium nigriterrae TaxID=3127512 RepID=UPI003013C4B9
MWVIGRGLALHVIDCDPGLQAEHWLSNSLKECIHDIGAKWDIALEIAFWKKQMSHRYDQDIIGIRSELDAVDLQISINRLLLLFKDYTPDQPRAPAGQADGGQWISVGDPTESAEIDSMGSIKPQNINNSSQEFCDDQYKRDIFQCRMVGLRSCYAQAMVSLIACERGNPIPPLNY